MFDASEVPAGKDEDPLPTEWAHHNWQQELKNNITTIDLRKVVGAHPMNIPRYYLSLID